MTNPRPDSRRRSTRYSWMLSGWTTSRVLDARSHGTEFVTISPSYSPCQTAAIPFHYTKQTKPCSQPAGWTAFQIRTVRRRGLIRKGSSGGTRPSNHVGRGVSDLSRPQNSSASGQFAANASLIRLAVSRTGTAIFNSRSLMVENSPLANGCGLGMASRTVRTSQYAAVYGDQTHLVGQGRATTGPV